MTERAGGSDVGTIETVARFENGAGGSHGDKWFCSHADADVALLLARPEGAPAGTKGLALFALPRRLEDGSRNAYRIVRLKDKLGTRSMASGEILLEGAFAWLVGKADQGLKQMMEQVNLSRLSHGVRAASMMRRCVNEAMVCARSREAFGRTIIDYPLLRRQLMKITVPAEQALSMFLFAASAMDRANAGDAEAESLLRILTPLLKFRACRDNIPVATGAMEVRGGNGYIEEWVNARLVRDAHIGVLWEGTSNINALDIITRAVGRSRAHRPLAAALTRLLDEATAFPRRSATGCGITLDRAMHLAERVAADDALEDQARKAASGLYHITSAMLMTWEASRAGHRCAPGAVCAAGAGASAGRAGPAGAGRGGFGARGGGIAAERAERIAGRGACVAELARHPGCQGEPRNDNGVTAQISSASLDQQKVPGRTECTRAVSYSAPWTRSCSAAMPRRPWSSSSTGSAPSALS